MCVCYTFNSRKTLTILISRRSDVGFLSLLYTFFFVGVGGVSSVMNVFYNPKTARAMFCKDG